MSWRWHKYVLRHVQERVNVSPPMWDISAIGILIKCSCGESFAL